MFLSTLILAATALSQQPEVTTIKRTYAVDEKVVYDMSIDAKELGLRQEVTGKITLTANKPDADGKITGKVAVDDVMNAPIQVADKLESALDEHGVLFDTTASEAQFPMMFLAVGCHLPAVAMKEGDSVDINWKGKTLTMKGSAKYLGVEEKDGKKLASFKTTLKTDEGTDEEKEFTITSKFDPANGQMQSSEIELILQGKKITCNLKVQAKPNLG